MEPEYGPRVSFELPYDRALRLSFMARFPKEDVPGDFDIAEVIDAAIRDAEATVADV